MGVLRPGNLNVGRWSDDPESAWVRGDYVDIKMRRKDVCLDVSGEVGSLEVVDVRARDVKLVYTL